MPCTGINGLFGAGLIDIGGQDSKAVRLDPDGQVVDAALTNVRPGRKVSGGNGERSG
jgi:activator of 2-hydroxyglutaryl-CoA dehydratase